MSPCNNPSSRPAFVEAHVLQEGVAYQRFFFFFLGGGGVGSGVANLKGGKLGTKAIHFMGLI